MSSLHRYLARDRRCLEELGEVGNKVPGIRMKLVGHNTEEVPQYAS